MNSNPNSNSDPNSNSTSNPNPTPNIVGKFRGLKVVRQGIEIYSTDFPWHVVLNYNLPWFGTRWVIILELVV